MASILRRIWDSILFTKRSRTQSRATKRRSLKLESLEVRQTMDATISGVVFTDVNNDGNRQTTEALLGNITVRLYRDVNTDGLLDAGDTLVDTEITPTTGVNQGRYTLTATVTGQHLVVQDTVAPGLIQRATQRVRTVNVTSVASAEISAIDNYSITTPLFTADPAVTNPNFATTGTGTADIIGGVRDLHANAATGALTVAANLGSSGVLDFGNSSGGQGVYIATYDGDATNATNVLGTGLGAGVNDFDMTVGGTASFIRIVLAAETNASDATLTIRGRDNNSTEVLLNAAAIPERASAADPLLTIDVPFSAFPTGFDPTQVGGLQFEITNIAGQQVVIDNIGLFGNTIILPEQNIANLNPMTIGNQVFRDINNNGLLDGTDSGIGGVTVQLYEDTNGDGSLSPAEQAAQPAPTSTTTSTTVGTLGQYTFTGLFPGSYVVVIPNSQFNASAPLDNMTASIIPVVPPANNGNTGALVTGLGVASAVTLVAGAAPVDDNDTDANTNLSRDFGFAPPALTITKDDNPDIARVGDQLTYTITVRNDSPAASGRDSTNTIITDTLPTGLTLVGTPAFTISNPTGTAGNASFDTGTRVLTANVGTLVPGQFATLIVIATVGATFVNPTTNTVNASNAEGSAVTANVSTPAAPNVDLGITKTIVGGATTVLLGGTLTYRLTITNNTAVAVTGVVVNDDLPAGFVPGTLPSGVATGTAPADLVWSVGNLAASGTATIDIPVTVPTTVALGSATNTATIVVANQTFTDLVAGNNQSSVDVTVNPRYDLRVAKTNNLTALATGQTFTYTITATNDGPSTANNVTVSDTLPASLEFISSTVGSPPTGQQFTANLGNITSGNSASVNVVVRVRSSATGANIANTATVTADNAATQERDASNNAATGNNTATDTDPLTRTVTLQVRKDASAATAVAGGANFTYTIIGVNSGNADTTGVNISDPLPTGIEFVSGTFSLDDGSNTTGNVSFDTTTRTVSLPSTVTLRAGGTLGAGNTSVNEAIITLTVRAAATAAAGSVNNVATLRSADNTVGVTDDAPVTINRDFDVTVTKADNVETVTAGQALTYTIVVTNTGTSTATNIQVSDPLPSTLTFVSATAGFTNTSGTVSGTIASLAAGASTTITIGTTVRNDAPNATAINNTVTVTAAGESNTNNNTATAAATVVSTASLTGRVYIDSDNNGLQGAGEAGIAGVTINLTGTSTTGTPVTRSTTTNANGEYTFADLPIGTYTVSQVQPANFRSRSTNVGSVNGTASGTGTENQIATINLTANSVANDFGETLVQSKRRFLASSTV